MANGVYRVEEEIKPAFAHEPVLQHIKDGRWLLYSIGGPKSSSGPVQGCHEGYSPTRRLVGESRNGGSVGFSGPVPVTVFVSKTLTGKWKPLAQAIGQGDINPAPLVFDNGTTVMMWRGGDAWYHVHLARADSWNGTYSYNGTGTIFPGFDRHGIEDPFVYAQPHPETNTMTYHAIFHDHATFGGHAFSRDGVSWTYSTTVPFTNYVEYIDGSSILLQRRERPHLIFDDAGYITHLTNGVQPAPTATKAPPKGFANDFTFTLVQPVQPQSMQVGNGG